jgi:cell division septation protein DedD
VGLKYGRIAAAAYLASLVISTAGAGTALAADPSPTDIVMDGVVTVHWNDPVDGPMDGATIRISWYHEGDATPSVLPEGLTDEAGDAVITSVPRAADGAVPILLDIRGDRSTATTGEDGCITTEDWLAQSNGVPSAPVLEVSLGADTKGLSVSCPEPTPTPAPTSTATPVVEPTPTPVPTATSTPVVEPTRAPTAKPTGGVLGTTGTPAVTPPSTDTVGVATNASGSPFASALLGLIAFALVFVPAASLALVRAQARSRIDRARGVSRPGS